MNLKKDIRAAVKALFPTTTMIEVAIREVRTGAPGVRSTSVNAMEWAPDEDLFDKDRLSRTKLPKTCVLDCWLYEGRGEDRELEDHATVIIADGKLIRVTSKHWSEVVAGGAR